VDKLGTRDMEAAYGQIQAEERRAARIAHAEDERWAAPGCCRGWGEGGLVGQLGKRGGWLSSRGK
jgi:hypothetical protein